MRRNQKIFKAFYNKKYNCEDENDSGLAASAQFLLDKFSNALKMSEYQLKDGTLENKKLRQQYYTEIEDEQDGIKVDPYALSDEEIATIEVIRETARLFIPDDLTEGAKTRLYQEILRGGAGYFYLSKTENYAHKSLEAIQKNFHNKIYADFNTSVIFADTLESRFELIKSEKESVLAALEGDISPLDDQTHTLTNVTK